MNRLTAQTIKLSLVAFAGLMLICPALLAPCPVSSDTSKPSRIGTNPSQNLILFRRGTLDTDARPALDTSKEDQKAASVMSASDAKATRVVQFAGPIKSEWIDALRATGVEIVGYVPNNAYVVRGGPHDLARLAGHRRG